MFNLVRKMQSILRKEIKRESFLKLSKSFLNKGKTFKFANIVSNGEVDSRLSAMLEYKPSYSASYTNLTTQKVRTMKNFSDLKDAVCSIDCMLEVLETELELSNIGKEWEGIEFKLGNNLVFYTFVCEYEKKTYYSVNNLNGEWLYTDWVLVVDLLSDPKLADYRLVTLEYNKQYVVHVDNINKLEQETDLVITYLYL